MATLHHRIPFFPLSMITLSVVASFQRNQLSIWSGSTTPVAARMEEYPPGGDYASVKDDPSKTDNPLVTWTPSPAGEQLQGEGERSQLAGCCVLRDRVAHICSRIVRKLLLTPQCCPRLYIPTDLSRGDDCHSSELLSNKVSSATSGERHGVYVPLPHSTSEPLYRV